jgi:hypothetical protein
MAINDRKNIMASKFHLILTFKFQNSFFKFQFIRLIIDLLKLFLCFKLNHRFLLCFSNSLQILGGKTMAQTYLFYRRWQFGCLAKHVALLVVSTTGVYLKKYTPKAQ